MASMVGLEVVDQNLTALSGNSAEFFDKAPTQFSTIMAIVVGLGVVEKSSTPISGNSAKKILQCPDSFFDHNGYRRCLEVVD